MYNGITIERTHVITDDNLTSLLIPNTPCAMWNMANVNRIHAWDGSAEIWTEHEGGVLWFEQSFHPSALPQLVVLFVEALTGPSGNAMQSERSKRTIVPGILRQAVGVLAILKLADYFWLKRRSVETLAEWSIRSDEVHKRVLSDV